MGFFLFLVLLRVALNICPNMIYVYVKLSFFVILRTHLFMLAPLSETSDEVGTIPPLGTRCRRFGRDPCSVSHVASLFNYFGLGHT